MHDLYIIYITGMLGISKAIPVGLMLKTPPYSICLMTILGASTMVIVIYTFGGWIRHLVSRKMNKNKLNKRKMKADKLVSKFGVVGLGLIGTVTMGPNITILMGLIVVTEKRKLLIWILIGILSWTIILTSAATLSSEIFERIFFFR